MRGTEELTIARVLSRGLRVATADPASIMGTALLFGALPASIIGFAVEIAWDIVERAGGDAGMTAMLLLSLVAGMVTNMTVQGALASAVLADADGRCLSAGEAMRPAWRALGALIASGIAIGTAVLAAATLLVIPGLLLYALWSVAAPAIVAERCGVLAGLRRSAALVRPVFWRVVLLNMLLLFGYLAFSIALSLAGTYLWHGAAALASDDAAPMPLSYWFVFALAVTPASAAWAAVIGALFTELRERAEGRSTDHLARIFA